MKTFTKAFATLLLLSGSIITGYSQRPCLDSICVLFDDKMELKMTIYDYKALSENVEKDFKHLQSVLKDNKEIPEKISYAVTYEPNKKLSVMHTAPAEKIIWEKDKQTNYHFNNQCNIKADNYFVQIQFNDAGELLNENFAARIKKIIDSTHTIHSRFSKAYSYSYQGESLLYAKQPFKISGQKDVISLKGGVGMNFVKNRPIIDLSAEIGFNFCKSGMLKNQYYISYNQLTAIDFRQNITLNGFVNFGYRYNLSNNIGKPNWLGVELGYLALRQGGLFEKNTFKLGVNWEISKYISVSPQLYISGDLTKFYPGIRIGFGF